MPLLHIVDATAEAILASGVSRVALLGTRFTMEDRFYTDCLAHHRIDAVVPDAAQRATVHDIIFKELCKGVIREPSRSVLVEIVGSLAAQGAEAVILGCTELPLLLTASDVELPVFDTTTLHALSAVDFSLSIAA